MIMTRTGSIPVCITEFANFIWLFRIFTYEAGNLMLEMVYYEKLVL